MKGGKRLVSDVQTLAETPFLGGNEAAKRALARSQALEEQYGTGADFSRVKEAYGKSGEGILPAAGELLKQSGLSLTEMIPYLAEMGVAGKLGAKMGSPLAGIGAGAYVPRVSQNIEEQAAAQQEAGEPIDVNIEKAAGYAIPRAALDVASSVLPLGKNLAGKLFGNDVVKLLDMGGAKDAELAAQSRLTAAARGVGMNLAEQVPIQVAQAALGRMQLGKPLLTEDAIKEYEQAGYVAGLMSPMGAIGGLGERSAAVDNLAIEKAKQAAAAKKAEEEQAALAKQQEVAAQRAAEEKPGIDTETGQTTFAPELFDYDKDKYAANAPQVEEPTPPTAPVPYSGQEDMFGAPTGGLFGNELLSQRGYDTEAEEQQRAAGEALAKQKGVTQTTTAPEKNIEDVTSRAAEAIGIGQDKYQGLVNRIAGLTSSQWVTPSLIAKQLGIDIPQAKDVMKNLESDGYIANPNKSDWYKPTDKARTDAAALPRARMMGANNISEEGQRRAPMMGGRNLTSEEQRRAPMIGGRNLLAEEPENVSDTGSDVGGNVGPVGGEKPVTGGPTGGTKRAVQQGRTAEPSTEKTGVSGLASDRAPTSEPNAGTGGVRTTLTPEDRSRVLRMPYVEAKQAEREANEPGLREQMAADKEKRAADARRAAVVNETQRLGSLARREAPTRSERAVDSLKKGNLGEALYHLTNEAGGDKPELLPDTAQPYRRNANEVSPLRYLARAMFNTIHRGDFAEREKIIAAEIARKSQEIGETQNRSITEREKTDIRNRILNDHKLTKVDVLDVDGKLTAAGRIIYKAGKNGKPLVDKEGNLVRNFTPDSQRLVPVSGKARLNTYSGEVESLNGSKVLKGAFAGAEVVVEKPRMSGEDKAVIERLKKEEKLAEYDPKQNKFYFTEAGLNDRTMLHEMVHAATVKVLKQYEDAATRKNLSEAQRIGAQELNKIYAVAKKQLGKEHAAALENIYEFASHAATDKAFQQALSEIPAGMLGTVTRRAQPSLWNMFTRALAKMFGLDHAQGKTAGNALLNATQAIHDILSTPERGTDVPPLAERAPPNTGTARATETAEKINEAYSEGNDKELLENIGRAHLDWGHENASPNFIEKAKRSIHELPASLRDGVNAFLSMDHLYQIYKKEVPAIKLVDDVINGRQASLLMRKMGLRDNLVEFKKIVDENKFTPTQMNNFHDIAIQSTLHQIELLDRPEKKDAEGNVTQRARKHVEGALYERYKALPEPMKEMYKTLRDEYDRMSDEYVAKLTNGLNVTEAQKLRASYEAARIPVYLPLYRRGKYWMSYKNKAGEDKRVAFRSSLERKETAERLKNEGATEIKSYEKLSDLRESGPPPSGFLNDVIAAMKKQGIKDSNLYDAVYETYLEYLPAQSVRQRFREREGILGMERDTFQTYANVATSMETLLNNLEYAPKLDGAMAKLREEAGEHTHDPAVMSAVRNIEAQVEFARNPKISNAVNKLGFFNYTWYLAANASSAIVNLTHLPMVVYPLLWGKHGTGPTEAAFANAFKQFKYKGQGKDLIPKGYEYLYNEALKTGALFEHMGQELYDLRETSVNDYTGLTKRVFEKMNYMFTITDRMNREATLMAGYDLSLKEMGTTREKATAEQNAKAAQEAIELVNKSYGTATLASGPRILQNNLARIMLTFKRFALNRMFILGRVGRDILKGETPEVKKMAIKQMLGIYGTAFAFGGIAGLPLYGAGTMLANMFMGDDDDPVDVDDVVRESTNDLAYRGPLNHYLNLAVSHRVGWNDMFWTDDPKRLAEVGVFTYSIERALGPAYSQLMQLGPAANHFANGRFERGLELMTPVAARNIMKAWRLGLQGATTANGEPIADVNVYNALMQGLGFAPADVSETQSKSSAGLALQDKIESRRKALLDQYYAAYNNGSLDGIDDAQKSIDRFNDKHPDFAISGSTISSSIKMREKRAQEAINGVNFNQKLQQEIMDKIGIEDNKD
jgi:ribosomal protein S25